MPQINPIIEFYDDEDYVYLRFRNMQRDRLLRELSTLKDRVRDKKWLSNKGYWQIPKSDLQIIALFAYERFGPDTLIPIKSGSLPRQMELPIND